MYEYQHDANYAAHMGKKPCVPCDTEHARSIDKPHAYLPRGQGQLPNRVTNNTIKVKGPHVLGGAWGGHVGSAATGKPKWDAAPDSGKGSKVGGAEHSGVRPDRLSLNQFRNIIFVSLSRSLVGRALCGDFRRMWAPHRPGCVDSVYAIKSLPPRPEIGGTHHASHVNPRRLLAYFSRFCMALQ